jgi:glutathione peroxidase
VLLGWLLCMVEARTPDLSVRAIEANMSTVYDFAARDITGREVSMSDYRGRVLLIVNTASKCGFTPQYEGLEKLYDDLREKGLVVLGFPCNQFGQQEPGDAAEIASFGKLTYDVSFPMFSKIDVNGPGASPLFVWLKESARGLFGSRQIKWNFTKFLVDREGHVVQRFAPTTKPEAIRTRVGKLLAG